MQEILLYESMKNQKFTGFQDLHLLNSQLILV